MRINKFLAQATGLSRRAADEAISQGRVLINGQTGSLGSDIPPDSQVTLDGRSVLVSDAAKLTIMLNKPVGFVCSREGQGSRTIYDLLPPEFSRLKPAGRLDKDSCGLVIVTDDGELAQQLTHPRYDKTKVYEIRLNQPLQPMHQQIINDTGITLEDGLSRLDLHKLNDEGQRWQVTMNEGRNRQIRRTFQALGYTVTDLKRLALGSYKLGNLAEGDYKEL